MPPPAERPVFYLLAGPNGAGKSTLYKALAANGTLAPGLEFINADLHEAAHLQHIPEPQARSEAARVWAEQRRTALLGERRSFVSETVFSHPSKLALIAEAQAAGFLVVLIVVALDEPQRLLARVRQRVAEGGHAVPDDRVLARYPRTLALLAQAVRQVPLALLYDSEVVEAGTHRLVAVCRAGVAQPQVTPLPAWAATLLAA
ncbi:zeta toxin family protein [Xenophilus arseniciresistens]|uniref:Zeta toxin family protein n=1 Tax=Xenophilus arseniciresistens TaxID=1283306 RepID=A0AAE3N5G2_9BURK|nr:zeta toxin family protein [Xenophilus arseniciresistens]MDA7415591.1 zeta toxin family protein [Xenophilus arseniciresistens]